MRTITQGFNLARSDLDLELRVDTDLGTSGRLDYTADDGEAPRPAAGPGLAALWRNARIRLLRISENLGGYLWRELKVGPRGALCDINLLQHKGREKSGWARLLCLRILPCPAMLASPSLGRAMPVANNDGPGWKHGGHKATEPRSFQRISL